MDPGKLKSNPAWKALAFVALLVVPILLAYAIVRVFMGPVSVS